VIETLVATHTICRYTYHIITPYPGNKFDGSTTENEVNELLKRITEKK